MLRIFNFKQAPVGTGISRARNLRWGMLLHVNEARIYGGQNKQEASRPDSSAV